MKYQPKVPKSQAVHRTKDLREPENEAKAARLKKIQNDYLFGDSLFEDREAKGLKKVRAHLFKIVPKKTDWQKKLEQLFTTKGFADFSPKEKPYLEVDRKYLKVVSTNILEIKLEIITYTLRKYIKFTAYE